ncbi:MAG: hypothetical protein OXU23_05430 [Candidatus Poribacteria bacterium]|nr:hypothetical protein [Candidatus Poribacteria bacterium]
MKHIVPTVVGAAINTSSPPNAKGAFGVDFLIWHILVQTNTDPPTN